MRKCLLLLLLLPSLLRAQFLFRTLKPSDGLASRESRCLFRDGEGYVWAGSNNGLNRFDGAHFKLWNKLASGYPDSLGEIVTTITEHGNGQIWFGTNSGIGVLNKAGNEIAEVNIRCTNKGRKLAIGKMQHDGSGRLWAAANRGLLVEHNGELVAVSTVYPFAKELDTLAYIGAAFVYDAGRNCFWIGTLTGSYCLDLKQRQVFSAANNPGNIPFFTRQVISSIAQDGKGNLWFCNGSASSLCFYDFNTGAFQQITRINNNPAWKLDAGCNTLFIDRQGRLWISTWLYIAFVRYPDGRFEEIRYNSEAPYSIGYGFFYDVFQDKYNNVWLCTLNGISKLEASQFIENVVRAPTYKFYLPIDFANINCMETDEKETWWLGKMEGLVKYNTATKTFQRFIVSATDLRSNEVFTIRWIGGELWCSTTKGVQIFNPVTNRFRPFNSYSDRSAANTYVFWVLKDRQGFIWISVLQHGVYRYDPQSGRSVHFTDSTTATRGDMKTLYSPCAFEASDGKLWISSEEGIHLFDPATQKFSRPSAPLLNNVRFTGITEDSRHNIWLASVWRGIVKCNTAGIVMDSITRKDGLPLNIFDGIAADAQDRLWTVSRENLVCILPDTKEVTRVAVPASFSFNDHWNSVLRKGNLLYTTMYDNVVVINTRKYQQLPQHVSPLISGFRVFGKEMSPQQGIIHLQYNQNFFSFDFASPFHQEALSMQYAYKLAGFDRDWVYCGRNLTAAYTNVPDGEYTFLVRTTDERGRWMEELSKVRISIQSPYWKTWWFVTLMALTAAFAVYLVYRWRQRSKRKKRMDETINYFANSHYGDNSINEICWDMARNCISQLRLEDCVVYLTDEKRAILLQKAAYGPKNPKEHEISNPIEIRIGEGIVGAAAAACRPVLVNDTTKDSRYIVDDAPRLSELAVPIIHEGKAIGVIDSEHSKKAFFTKEHLKTLTTIAAISANKIAEAKAEAAARESDIQLLEIKKLLAETQLMALRAQMNPHFVFNCLNSIQECIVTQKYGEASLYLNKFAKLFRSVLNNSGKIMVTLAEEIEVLELYLILEYMRFGQSFDYTIQVDDALESDEIMIPSMLLQPYVENALWHGLMHKGEDRRLTICFQKTDEDIFQCIIDDNGIGRKKAMELKEQQNKTKRHVSRGMGISKDRIELLQKQGEHAMLTIIDKINNTGEAAGTRIIIELSTYLKT